MGKTVKWVCDICNATAETSSSRMPERWLEARMYLDSDYFFPVCSECLGLFTPLQIFRKLFKKTKTKA